MIKIEYFPVCECYQRHEIFFCQDDRKHLTDTARYLLTTTLFIRCDESENREQRMENNYLDNNKSLAPEKKLQYLAVRRGVYYEQDWLNWCDEALEAIEELEKL